MKDLDPEALADSLMRALGAAAPHLAAAGRELLAAGQAFFEALMEDPAADSPRVRIPVDE